jgi:hypothetical protein
MDDSIFGISLPHAAVGYFSRLVVTFTGGAATRVFDCRSKYWTDWRGTPGAVEADSLAPEAHWILRSPAGIVGTVLAYAAPVASPPPKIRIAARPNSGHRRFLPQTRLGERRATVMISS